MDQISSGVPVWITLLATLIPLAGAYLAYRQATKAAKATREVESKKVDAEAYLVAKGFYEDMLSQRKSEATAQQAQILQLNDQVIELQKSINEMQHLLNSRLVTEAQLREQIERLGKELARGGATNDHLALRITQLEGALSDKGFRLPPTDYRNIDKPTPEAIIQITQTPDAMIHPEPYRIERD
jgi:TolA-binding protein